LCAFTALKKYASSLFVTNQFSKINHFWSYIVLPLLVQHKLGLYIFLFRACQLFF